jgi:seryl-tRNA synthetase
MIDIGLLRRDPGSVRSAARRRGGDGEFVDRVLALDESLRAARTNAERLRSEKNALSSGIGRAADRAAEAERLRPQLAELDAAIAIAGAQIPELESAIDAALSDVPNLLDDSVPDGAGEHDNFVAGSWGEPRRFAFTPKPHWEIGEALGILDLERAAKLAGARFAVLRGPGARLSRALVSFFLQRANERGYVEIDPPFLVNRSTMWSTGQLSKFADAMFWDTETDLFLIPTSEVPLTALHRDEILAAADLPLQYTAYSPCFRKEAGAAGKDTRGLIRLHQFEKVELVWLTQPERSFEALETLTRHAASLLEELELPYRVMALCAGDVGFSAAKTYDLEVWLPGQNTFREISSCSNCTDFQARRSGIRFRREARAKPEFVHTLNGSGLAVGRTLLAILENGQTEQGGVILPEALRPFAGFSEIRPDGSAV